MPARKRFPRLKLKLGVINETRRAAVRDSIRRGYSKPVAHVVSIGSVAKSLFLKLK